MTPALLAAFVIVPAALVVVAMSWMLWRARTTPRSGAVAILSGVVLAGWGGATAILANRGVYLPPPVATLPPIGLQLLVALGVMGLALRGSPSLRSLLTNQTFLIRLNVWRLVGALFVALMVSGQMPAVWALPAGLGDVLVGSTAFWVASRVHAPGGKRLATIFNLVGLADLVVAVGLGVTTSPPLQVFRTTPTAELITHFPLALVPGFLVPLAVMVHVVSLWQLSGRPWLARGPEVRSAVAARSRA
ncbi:MAG: hypothetical protein ACM358_06600 [Gemmatimonadota bacterium]